MGERHAERKIRAMGTLPKSIVDSSATTIVFPGYGEVDCLWETVGSHRRLAFATERHALRFALGLGHPHLEVRDALGILLTQDFVCELPNGTSVKPRPARNAIFRTIARFTYRLFSEMNEAGFTPAAAPPRISNVEDRSQRQAMVTWANGVHDRLAAWWHQLRPLLIAAELGEFPAEQAERDRLFAISKVKHVFDAAPPDLDGDLERVTNEVSAEARRRGRPIRPIEVAEFKSEIHAHDDPRKMYKDKDGVLHFNPRFVADKLRREAEKPIEQQVGEHQATSPEAAERIRAMAGAADRVDDPLEVLDRLDLVERLERLSDEDRELVDEAFALGLGPDEWGGRKHFAVAKDRGYGRDRKTLRREMLEILDRIRRSA